MVWGVSKKQKIGIDVANARECHEEREKKSQCGRKSSRQGDNDNEWNEQNEVN